MSNDEDWHVAAGRLVVYASGAAAFTERDSIEAHLLACEHCRSNLAGARPSAGTAQDAMLAAILERIDRPRRLLNRRTGALQVSLASPALVAASALLAVLLLAGVGLSTVIEPALGIAVLIAVAPLLPAAAAAVAFWPTTDPAGSLSVATPLAAGLLPFLRALFAATVATVAGVISSAFTPLEWSQSLLWLGPGCALAAIVIAAATWMSPVRLAMGLSGGWLVLCALWVRRHRGLATIDAVEQLVSNGARIQIISLIVIGVASTVTLSRRHALPNWRIT
ncbi:MAG: zf-HC2 domain-containing protein [Acidimicrobiales bacterium]